MAPPPLAGLSVVELRGSVAGAFTTKLLSDYGAEVVVVQAPAPASSAPLNHASSVALDRGKHAVGTLDDGALRDLVGRADVVVESSAPGPLRPCAGPGGLDHPDLIAVRLSPFGSTGPYRSWRATDCIDYAMSGHLLLTGDPDREPVQGPAHQPAYAAGLHAAIAVMAALEARRHSERGQVVEVAHHEVMVALHQFTLLRYTHNGDLLHRMGNRYAGPGQPIGLYRCADGFISLTVPRDDQLERLLALAGLTDLLERPGIGSTYDLMHHPTLLDEHLRPWLATQPAGDTVELLQAMRVPASPVHDMAALLADPHLADRSVWETAEGEPTVLVPRPPLRISVLGSPSAPGPHPSAGLRTFPVRSFGGAEGPLAGLRVIDLTRVWAGPLATRILADLGADVVMVEAPWARGPATIDRSSVEATRYYPDNDPGAEHWNRIGFVNKYSINKRAISLDVSLPQGREALERLVGWADVVIENYSPRVMPQLGFDEARLAELNPALVYVTMPGFGRSGPAVDWVAYGPTVDSHAGLSVLQGYADEAARKGGVAWPDPVAGMHAAFGVLVALAGRRGDTNGQGRVVEIAQLEATLAMVADALVRYQLSGKEPRRCGNRHDRYAPQGVYRSAGADRWLALSVSDDGGWASLVTLAGFDPAWAAWNETERRARHDQIDAALTGWTTRKEAAALAAALQAVGVAAAPVNDAAAVMADPQLHARQSFVRLEHPDAGAHLWPRFAARLSATPATYRRAGPRLGQHNDEVLTELAGYGAEELAQLRACGALTDRPPG